MMKNIRNEDSEEEEQAVDDPDEKQDSDEDWQPDAEENTTGRASRRLRNLASAKKPRLAEPSVSDEEVEEEEEEDDDEEEFEEDSGSDESYSERSKKSKRRKSTGNRGRAKAKVSEDEEAAPDSHLGKEFVSGAFVILKTDFDKEEKPPIWRIDGNELLQKYLPFESENKTLYKSTITYWGWSEKSKGLYDLAPVSIIKAENNKVLVVEVLKSEIKSEEAEVKEEAE